MRVELLTKARLDVRHAYEYIRSDSVKSANDFLEVVEQSIERLSVMPQMGRIGRVKGTRELVLSPNAYILVYIGSKESVNVLAVVHTSRTWPEVF